MGLPSESRERFVNVTACFSVGSAFEIVNAGVGGYSGVCAGAAFPVAPVSARSACGTVVWGCPTCCSMRTTLTPPLVGVGSVGSSCGLPAASGACGGAGGFEQSSSSPYDVDQN